MEEDEISYNGNVAQKLNYRLEVSLDAFHGRQRRRRLLLLVVVDGRARWNDIF